MKSIRHLPQTASLCSPKKGHKMMVPNGFAASNVYRRSWQSRRFYWRKSPRTIPEVGHCLQGSRFSEGEALKKKLGSPPVQRPKRHNRHSLCSNKNSQKNIKKELIVVLNLFFMKLFWIPILHKLRSTVCMHQAVAINCRSWQSNSRHHNLSQIKLYLW